ncbi:hypothetical protein MTR67_048937 [Solanum verrucosum]|uniref:Uncharacterized protein n=1 Tax=Solanum verrucosum TaxID=315347 RepID=A0AAF0UZE9_SOLVR|nr:hypothetical protein MTR67_048937 [Solanum verrucosum]
MAPKPKEKAKASAVAIPAISIEDLFTSLNRHIQRSEYEQAVKVSDQILAAAPGDEDAIRCKVVALVKADSIEEALVAIKDSRKKGSVDLSFFKKEVADRFIILLAKEASVDNDDTSLSKIVLCRAFAMECCPGEIKNLSILEAWESSSTLDQVYCAPVVEGQSTPILG